MGMGKKAAVWALAALCCLGLSFCDGGNVLPGKTGGEDDDGKLKNTGTVKITYYENKSADDKKVFLEYDVLKGTATDRPVTVPGKEGYRFEDWYAEKKGREPFDFTKKLSADTAVYARYTNSVELPSVNDDFYKLPVVFGKVMQDLRKDGAVTYSFVKKFENEHGDYIVFSQQKDGSSLGERYTISYYRKEIFEPIEIEMTGYDVAIEKSMGMTINFHAKGDEGGDPDYVHKDAYTGYFCPDYRKVDDLGFLWSFYFMADDKKLNYDKSNPDLLPPTDPKYAFSMKYNDWRKLDAKLCFDISLLKMQSYGVNKIVLAEGSSRLYRWGVYYEVEAVVF